MQPSSSRQPAAQTSTPDNPWIATYSGRRLSLSDPQSDQICYEDICRGLSHQPRFTGQTEFHWSVAAHTILCHAAYLQHCADTSMPIDEDIRCGILLHDAQEAYLGDDTSPKKQLNLCCTEHEQQLQNVILNKYGITLTTNEWTIIKGIDNGVKHAEAKALMPNVNLADWPKPFYLTPVRLAGLTFRVVEYKPSQMATLLRELLFRYIGDED